MEPVTGYRESQAERARLSQREAIGLVLESNDFTEGEKRCVKWQFRRIAPMGSFFQNLWEALACADPENLEHLRRAFPEDVAALEAYRRGDLVRRLEAAGVSV